MPDLSTLWSKQPITHHDAQQLADQVRALADPTRLQILSIIAAHNEQTVTDLIVALHGRLSQPTVSHHLKLLERAGFVTHRRAGVWVFYRVLPEAVTAVVNLLRPGRAR